MHLTLSHELLSKATDLVAKVADRHHRFVILGNIKFDLSDTELVMTASDLEVELTVTVRLPKSAISETGSITLPAGKFHEITKSLPKEAQITLQTLDHERCLITSGKSKFTLSALPANDFPSIGTPSIQKEVTLMRDELHAMLGHTRFCMATQDARHYLTGMLFHIQGALLTCVASDGHRLAVSKRTLQNEVEDTQIIVPGKAVIELERLFGELSKSLGTDDLVSLGLDQEFLQVRLNFGQPNESGHASDELTVTMTARLIDGKFPDYQRILPTNCDKTALFPKEAMGDVLRRVSILSNERSRGVVMDFGDNSVTVRSGKNDSGEAIESLALGYEGEPIEISLNESYLKAVFAVLSGDIRLQMSHPNSPTLITQVGDELHQYVVMPMRI